MCCWTGRVGEPEEEETIECITSSVISIVRGCGARMSSYITQRCT